MKKKLKQKRHRFPTDLQDELSIYCFKLRTEQDLKLQKIGAIIHRHHATVLYHIERYEKFMQVDKSFRQTNENFNEELFAQKLLELGIEPYQNLTIN